MKLLYLLQQAALVASLVAEHASLRTEGVVRPLGLHSANPRLSWRLSSDTRGDAQTAYQVQAASSVDALKSPDVWDTGKTTSGQPFAVYNGKALSSRQAVSWRTRVWDVNDKPSEWSEVTTFEMGLLKPEDWTAAWIANEQFKTGVNSLPMFAKAFEIGCSVRKARLYITGLGVFRAEINGKPVSKEVLGPGYSTINRTVLYRAYDATSLVQFGSNAIGVELGKGTYDAEKGLLKRYMKFTVDPKPLLVKSQLEYTCEDGKTGQLLSDKSWLTTTNGPQIEASWYGGEEYDARKAIPDWSSPKGDKSSWQNANVSAGPAGPPGQFFCQAAPQLEITETIPAKTLKQAGSQWLYDFGVNYAGWFTFTMNGIGKAGTRIVFYPAENLTIAGAPDQKSTGSPIFDGFTLAGLQSETFTLKFMYHGSQYIAVNTTWEPSLSDMKGLVIRANNEPVGSVTTSNALFNKIHEIIDVSIKGNMHSVLTDCPHREKLGWLEQDHLVFEPVARGYDIEAYGHDFMRTTADAQAQWGPEGMIPATAPEYVVFAGQWEIYRNDPNWGNAIMRFALWLWHYYGDRNALETYYPIMDQYMAYLARRQKSPSLYIIDDGGLADWQTVDHSTPTGLTNTYAYQQATTAMRQIAKVLRRCDDAKRWRRLEMAIQTSFHETWFNASGNPHYSTNSQAANALALDMGAVPAELEDAVFQSVVDSVERANWHFTVGEIGMPALFRVLMKRDRNDMLYRIMSQTTKSSYGYQIARGATSLWEHWDGDNEGVGSFNHFMFGFGDMWIHRLSGLAPADNSVMWNVINYAPIVVGDLTSASASYRTLRGNANASWSLSGKSLSYDIRVPMGAKGVVSLNGTDFTESGSAIEKGNGIISVQAQNGTTTIEVGGGSYSFKGTV